MVSEELLASIEEEVGEKKENGDKINGRWADQVKHAFREASSETTSFNKIMKMYPKPENLDIRVPKSNWEVEINLNFQKNNRFVSTKEKALYSTQNYICKAITLFAKMEDSDKPDTGSSTNYKDKYTYIVRRN